MHFLRRDNPDRETYIPARGLVRRQSPIPNVRSRLDQAIAARRWVNRRLARRPRREESGIVDLLEHDAPEHCVPPRPDERLAAGTRRETEASTGGYRRGAHTVYEIHIHLVWTTKYRKPVLVGNRRRECAI